MATYWRFLPEIMFYLSELGAILLGNKNCFILHGSKEEHVFTSALLIAHVFTAAALSWSRVNVSLPLKKQQEQCPYPQKTAATC